MQNHWDQHDKSSVKSAEECECKTAKSRFETDNKQRQSTNKADTLSKYSSPIIEEISRRKVSHKEFVPRACNIAYSHT